MAFVKFNKPGRSFKPRVSISSRGLISFSNGAVKRFEMGSYQWCALYYDSESRKVGIELLNTNESGEVVKLRLRSTGADISGSSFLSFFDIEIKDTNMYDLIKDDESGWLVFDLDKGTMRITKKKGNSEKAGI